MPKPMLVFSYYEIPENIMRLILEGLRKDDISCQHYGCIIYPDSDVEEMMPYYIPEFLPVANWLLSQGVKTQCVIHFDY